MEKKELRKISWKELEMILEKHRPWHATAGKEGERADLSYTDLKYADLTNAILWGSDLYRANLEGANLYHANLRFANLRDTNLKGADLSSAKLRCADLTGANLADADLRYANLIVADLTGADLEGVNLLGADLAGANLRGANLEGVNLWLANLQNTDLTDVKNFPNLPMACPETGSFISWKHAGGYIVKLEIPADAKRSSGTGMKCRCNKARVLSIETLGGTSANVTEVYSDYDSDFWYRVGETVIVDDFDDNRFNECAPGIHFFMDRDRAVRY